MNTFKKLIITALWLCSFFLGLRVGIMPWLFGSFDQPTLLFFGSIPLIIIYNMSSKSIGLIAIASWIFAGSFYIFGNRYYSQIFTILAFWLFTSSVIRGIFEIRKNE